MNKFFYYRPKGTALPTKEKTLSAGYEFHLFKPFFHEPIPWYFWGYESLHWRIKLLSLIWGFFWLFHPFNGFIYSFYLVFHDKKLVSCLGVSSGYFSFPYVGPRDVQMGPGVTHRDHQGQGLYSFLLGKAVRDYNAEYGIWMLTDETNMAARAVYEGLGFPLYGTGRKKKKTSYGILPAYVIEKKLNK